MARDERRKNGDPAVEGNGSEQERSQKGERNGRNVRNERSGRSEQNERSERNELARDGGGRPLRSGSGSLFDPFRPLLRGDLDTLFQQFFRMPAVWEESTRDWQLGMDVQDEDDRIVVRAEAPGFEPDDFELEVRGDELVMHATHRSENVEKGGAREWSRQEFWRTTQLPSSVDPDKVDAKYRNGVLIVTLPKTEDGRGRRIRVQGG